MKRVLALALCLLFLGGCGTRLDKTSEFLKYKDKPTAAAVQSLCAEFFEDNGLAGLSVGVLVNGHATFFNYGQTQEGGAPITEDTRFDLGTLTQVFTGVTYAESIYRRYVSHGSTLKGLFPYLNVPLWEGESITLGQLATHTSGMPSAPTNLPREETPYQFYSELDLRKYLSGASLESQPGSVYSPDGMDMGLLGFAVSVARKIPYENQVKNVIMYSIGMTRTTATFAEESTDHLATWATPHSAQGQALPHQEYGTLQGMAAFKSTAYDLMLFAWCNMNMPGTEDTFSKPAAQGRTVEAQLYTPAYPSDNPEQKITVATLGAQSVVERLHASMRIAQEEHYSQDGVSLGYGYRLGQMGENQYIWQKGGDAGNGGYIGFVPGTATAVVVLANSGVEVDGLGRQILELLQN